MRRLFLPVLAVSLALFVASCGDDQTPPAAPRINPVYTISPDATNIIGLIDVLFPTKNVATTIWQGARDQFANVQRKKEVDNNLKLAKKMALTLVDFTVKKYKQNSLLDPNGSSSPTTREAVAALIRALYLYIGDPAPTDAEIQEILGLSTYTIVVDPATGGKAIEPDVFVVDAPPGAVNEPTIIVVRQLPKTPIPLANNAGQPYPFFFELSTEPDLPQFNKPVRFAICTAEPEDGGPPTTSYVRLRLGHGLTPTFTELLPLATAADLPCADHVDLGSRLLEDPDAGRLANGARALGRLASRTWELFAPASAYAVHAGLGGAVLKNTPFGAVDPGTTRPAVLTISPSAATVGVGGTVTLTAQAFTYDASNNLVASSPQPTVTWSSVNTAIATINATTGVVTGVAPGKTVIVATTPAASGGVTAFDSVTVASSTSLQGTVRDELGYGIPSAAVDIVNTTTSTLTDAGGFYSFSGAALGSLPGPTVREVRAQATGYAAARDTVTLVGTTLVRDLSLDPVGSDAIFFDNFQNGSYDQSPASSEPTVGTWTVSAGGGTIQVGGSSPNKWGTLTTGTGTSPSLTGNLATHTPPGSGAEYRITWTSSLNLPTGGGNGFAKIEVTGNQGHVAAVIYEPPGPTPTSGNASFAAANNIPVPFGLWSDGTTDAWELFIDLNANSYTLTRNGSPVSSGGLYAPDVTTRSTSLTQVQFSGGAPTGQRVIVDNVAVTIFSIPQ